LAALICAGLLTVSYTAKAVDEAASKNIGAAGKKVNVAKSFRVSQLTGMNVKNSEGESLGSVEDIVMDVESGKIAYVALSFGGVFGVGDKLFAVPYNQMKFTHGKEEMYFVLNVPKDRLKAAPGFDKDNWPDFADPQWIKSVDDFYGNGVAVDVKVQR
jgi:sporulation protein YlmC with PRC-barrel domain